jgi:hypothetical protein
MRILVLGDSHTQAIKQALKARRGSSHKNIEIEAYRYSKIKNGKEIGDLSPEKIVDRVAALDSHDLVVSTIGGNQHQTLSLVQHPVPFDLCMPGESEPTEPPAVENVIPYAQMWDVFERGLRGKDGERLRQLRKAAHCTVVHLTPPPPKEDSAHILKRHETDFVRMGILEKGISPAPLRLRMWQLQVDVLRRLTEEWDVQLLPPPAQALDAQGYLAPAYYADDATHANAAYGELLIEQVTGLLLSRHTPH